MRQVSTSIVSASQASIGLELANEVAALAKRKRKKHGGEDRVSMSSCDDGIESRRHQVCISRREGSDSLDEK